MSEQRSYWLGKTALVTGATLGIGKATALLLSRLGAHVVVHGRDHSEGEKVVAEISHAGSSASSIYGDLREADTATKLIDHAISETGRLDLLVNNAGANSFHGVLNTSTQEWDDCLNLDLRAVWLASKAAAHVMKPGSAIVNLSSNHAQASLQKSFPYNVAKAGVNALTQSLAVELASQGIRANAIAPGYIDTPINDLHFSTFADPQQARRDAENLHPLQRLGTASEVAHAVAFLGNQEQSGFTTGTILTIDGGRSALLEDPSSSEETNQ